MASQPNLNIYGDSIIIITNKIMRTFLSKKYSGYIQSTDLDTMKQATHQYLTLYFITIQGQHKSKAPIPNPKGLSMDSVQSIIRNTTCENILNIWFHRHFLNQSIITENGNELMYNILYVKLDNFLKQL
jgi:hypothetical protein